MHKQSMKAEIAEAEKSALAEQSVTDGFEVKMATWFAMECRTVHLRELTCLYAPAIDADCRIAGCGLYAGSLV